jgi:hypothetical protein
MKKIIVSKFCLSLGMTMCFVKLNAQTDFFKSSDYSMDQADIEYYVKKDSLRGKAKIKFWNSGKIRLYENTLFLEPNTFILTINNKEYIFNSNYELQENPKKKFFLTDFVLNAYNSKDPNFKFSKYKDNRIKKNVVFNSVIFEHIDNYGDLLFGRIYFYKEIPVTIYVEKKNKDGIINMEVIKVVQLIIDHKVIYIHKE